MIPPSDAIVDVPLGCIENENKENLLHVEDMCDKAKERLKRYKRETKFNALLEELRYTPFAIYLY
jgi:hypothetical protein